MKGEITKICLTPYHTTCYKVNGAQCVKVKPISCFVYENKKSHIKTEHELS
jgi:hypothetical protein